MGINLSRIWNMDEVDETKLVGEGMLYMKKMAKMREEMTGWERVQAIFETDEFGEISPEMYRIKDATMISMFLGAVLGGVGRSRINFDNFHRANAHELYETPQFAQKALQDRVAIGFFDGAFRIAWRLSAFTFMYMSISSGIAAYRDKAGIVDQVGGAAAAGFLYKAKDGPKAQISGLVFGGLLGLFAGMITVLGSKAVGSTPDELIKFQYRNIERRKQEVYESQKAHRFKSATDDLTAFHETFLADDELAMSRIKSTPIGKLTEAAKSQQLDPKIMKEFVVPASVSKALTSDVSTEEKTKDTKDSTEPVEEESSESNDKASGSNAKASGSNEKASASNEKVSASNESSKETKSK